MRQVALFVTLASTVLYLLLPVRTLIKKFNKKDFDGFGAKWYDDMIAKFQTDYDRANPITKKEGIIKQLKKLAELETNEEMKKELEKRQEMIKNNTESINMKFFVKTTNHKANDIIQESEDPKKEEIMK